MDDKNQPPPAQPGYPVQTGYPAQPGYQPVQMQPGAMYYGTPGAVAIQPGQPVNPMMQQQWMPRPQPIPGCPPGLEYLTQLDQLLIKQQIDIIEAFTNWEQKNKYALFNSVGQQCYFAFEESEICMRQCCGAMREFIMHIVDNTGVEVLRIQRPFICCGCGSCCICDSLQQRMSIQTPDGNDIGYLTTKFRCCGQKMAILDADGRHQLDISGPCCVCDCCSNKFDVTKDGNEVGTIKKQWAGIGREFFTKADNFGVTFDINLDVKLKASLLAATFLIDFMFFEQNNNNNH